MPKRKRTPSTAVIVGPGKMSDMRDHLPPQAEAVYSMLLDLSKEINSKELSEDRIKIFLEEKKSLLKSKQRPGRIYEYYRSLLVRKNLLVIR